MITEQPDHLGEVGRLMGLLVEGALEPVDCRRLEELLLADSAALEYYQDYIDLHCLLHWHHGQTDDEGGQREDGEEDSEFMGQEPGASVHPSSFLLHPSSIPPIIIDPSPTLHAPLFTLHSPVGSFVFSHLVAAVILGVGLLAGLAWRISLPTEKGGIVGIDRRQESPPTVGRITALADCRWKQWRVESGEWRANPEIPKSPNPQIPVSSGDRFALSSGFMEITYDTGAKVILEAPCRYEVESARSGFLAIGRLTALVEKGEGRRVTGEKEAGSRLSTLDSRLFSVRTPTAIVTDLGTEFGVEVEKSGTTRSHVFQGKVELRSQESSRGLTAPGVSVSILHAGESARVERGRNRTVVITRESGQPGKFVRHMPGGLDKSRESRVQSQRRQLEGSRLLTLDSRLRYRLTDLGTLGGATSRAFAINAAGQVAGRSTDMGGTKHAFLYTDGKMKNLGALDEGGNCSWSNGINASRHVVGGSGIVSTKKHFAFLHDGRTMKNLGTLGGIYACALGINDAGQVVGFSSNSRGVERAFLYTSRMGMKDLGALGGPRTRSRAYGINAVGQVVGYSQTSDGGYEYAFLYTPNAGMKNLGTLGGNRSRAFCINDAGQIVGFSTIHGRDSYHAFFYSEEMGMKDLGTLGGPQSRAGSINNAGQIVGDADCIDDHGNVVRHAFLYSKGEMIDLNSVVDTAGWTLHVAMALNDSGHIVSYGTSLSGYSHALLLTPVKELGARD